jgi:hypothetical protein
MIQEGADQASCSMLTAAHRVLKQARLVVRAEGGPRDLAHAVHEAYVRYHLAILLLALRYILQLRRQVDAEAVEVHELRGLQAAEQLRRVLGRRDVRGEAAVARGFDLVRHREAHHLHVRRF